MKTLKNGIVLVLLLIPIVIMVLLSLFSYYRYPILFPRSFNLIYWETLFLRNQLFIQAIKQTLIVSTLTAFFSTLVGFTSAKALVDQRLKANKILMVFISLPLFIPAIALFIGVHHILIRMNLANTYTGVILAHVLISLPYTTSIGITFFKGIDPNYTKIAQTLGAKQSRIITKIMVPLLLPGLILSFSIGFLLSTSEYFSTFIIGGGRVITLSTILYPYIENADDGNAAAVSVVFILFNILVFVFADRLSRRLTKGRKYLYE
ncbi:ABC transporter permease [Peloplasma aerotolerans]|uniref:ABC transporter permease subunit n=1 Tax=Peloplasma aerotolerans TaxID=3044389 RepID=A0AAW6U8S2_9MOLU|nr:ABC transporter permease subunit [Mariniplasma sp. M4Ah]MDI6453059.1 ABC transporter permease subunit [Mariniplasma sp. M4Ah]